MPAPLTSASSPDRLAVVDGLRAIAVCAVVLFHGVPALAPGGFIGVDIFFVISGFVIGLRYLEPLAQQRVRTAQFFSRRVWRLAPPYLAMLFASTLASLIFLNPRDLVSFGQGLIAQALYGQNIAFWVTGDYFIKALRKPLLHTWSLAVEEQFYLLFPLLAVAFRRSRALALTLLFVAALGSFGVGIVVGHVSPKTAFYLLPFRIWEFVVGIGCALIFERHRDTPSSVAAFVTTLAGLLAVLAACFAFDGQALFPGAQSLLATVGTAAICLAQDRLRGPLMRMFNSRVPQYLGRISYSWYLWHWPPITFYYALHQQPPGLNAAGLMIAIGFGLGALSYRWIERSRVLYRRPRGARPSAILLACSLPVVALSGVLIVVSDGLVSRYPPAERPLLAAQMDYQSYRCPLLARLEPRGGAICQVNSASARGGVLIIGDSHAAQARDVIAALGASRGIRVFLTKSNCKIIDYGAISDCRMAQWDELSRDVRREGITRAVVVSHYPQAVDRMAFARAFARLEALHVRLFLELSTPDGPAFNPATYLARHQAAPVGSGVSRDRQNTTRADQRAVFAGFTATSPNASLLDPTPFLCGSGECRFSVGGRPLYSDDNHLTHDGTALLKPMFATIFD